MLMRIGRGSIVIEWPEDEILNGLARFVHTKDGSGRYEELYTLSRDKNTLVTMPGFVNRIMNLRRPDRIKDDRVPMPSPNFEAAHVHLDTAWHRAVDDALVAGGGVMSVPSILGTAQTSAALIRAFPRDALAERGTPIAVVAADDRLDVREIALSLRRMLPERDIGMNTSGVFTDSDDVVCTTYGALDETDLKHVGLFIGDIDGVDFAKRAEKISMLRNAARFGVLVTPFGGGGIGMDVEGLFGPVVASATYDDAVKAGIGAPISVLWLPCPKPKTYLGPADMATMERVATRENPEFIVKVAEILRDVRPDEGCFVVSDDVEFLKRLQILEPVPILHQKLPKKERMAFEASMADGNVRKVAMTSGFDSCGGYSVMVSATCSGDVRSIPWRRKEQASGKTVIVDFRHDWDVHNGRPGYLLMADSARENKYREMGFASSYDSQDVQSPRPTGFNQEA